MTGESMVSDSKIMTLEQVIGFAARVHRCELADAHETDRMFYEVNRTTEVVHNSRDKSLAYKIAIELKDALLKNGIEFRSVSNNTFLYLKAIRVTLVESGWNELWVESVVRTLLDSSYIEGEKVSLEVARYYAKIFRDFYTSQDDEKIIKLLISARFNVRKYYEAKEKNTNRGKCGR